MKRIRLMELAGIEQRDTNRGRLNENSPALQKIIADLTDELADELSLVDDPLETIMPLIIEKLKEIVEDPNNNLTPDEISKLETEIRVFSGLLDKYSSTSIAKHLSDELSEARVYTHDYDPRELVPRMEGMVNMAEHKKMIDSIDKCMEDWYREGFDKNDILNYFHAVLPEGPND